MEERKRVREESVRLPPILHQGNSYDVTDAMVVISSPEYVVCTHPQKLSFLHFVAIPLVRPHNPQQYLTSVSTALTDWAPRISSFKDCEKALRKYKSNLGTSRWIGDEEIASFMSCYATTEKVVYDVGILALNPDIDNLQVHMVSTDYAYLDSADSTVLWNLYHSPKYFVPLPAQVETAATSLGTPLPQLTQLQSILTMTQLKCPICRIPGTSVQSLRKHIFSTHNQKVFDTKHADSETAKRAPASSNVKFPERPRQTDCKDELNAVNSLVMKWTKYRTELFILQSTKSGIMSSQELAKIEQEMLDAQRILTAAQEKAFLTPMEKKQLIFSQERVSSTTMKTMEVKGLINKK